LHTSGSGCTEITGVPFEITGVPFEIARVPFEITGVPFEITGVPFEITGVPFEIARVLTDHARPHAIHAVLNRFFWCTIVRDQRRRTFATPSDKLVTDDEELVDSILGESTPLGICRALEIPPEYLDLESRR
jgi:hypothetical protein